MKISKKKPIKINDDFNEKIISLSKLQQLEFIYSVFNDFFKRHTFIKLVNWLTKDQYLNLQSESFIELKNEYFQKVKTTSNYLSFLYKSLAHFYDVHEHDEAIFHSLNFLIKYIYHSNKNTALAMEERLRHYHMLLTFINQSD